MIITLTIHEVHVSRSTALYVALEEFSLPLAHSIPEIIIEYFGVATSIWMGTCNQRVVVVNLMGTIIFKGLISTPESTGGVKIHLTILSNFDAEKFNGSISETNNHCSWTTLLPLTSNPPSNNTVGLPILRYTIIGAGGGIGLLLCLITITCIGGCFLTYKTSMFTNYCSLEPAEYKHVYH